ncbi:MAG: adenosylmethionine--8-amino-7-oxononanoate transaminase [Nitrospinae bacterium]|nr:adenosylmethionine--8-amino-7-oxononanoate transaminase [Nitrospinota bacterium]
MLDNPKNNLELERDRRNIWHPCTQMQDHETVPPLLIERGEGIYLIDKDGKRYMDVISSWWVNLFGHSHPRLNAALKDQADRMAHVMFAGVTHSPAIDLAASLVELTPPSLSRVFFSDNGSTSIEIALKMSLQYWQQTGQAERTRFVHLSGGYHGETLGALSVCGIDLFRGKFEKVLMQNIEVNGPDCFRCPFKLRPESCSAECFEPMERTLAENGKTIAGVVVEPLVQGAAGMKMYPPVYLRKLEDACAATGAHTIYDEVAVAFGRTGALFVCREYGFNPTFLCLSKGITSGYLPLAATLTGEEIHQAFYGEPESKQLFIHSHSYAANPLACACANETLKMLRENDFLKSLQPKIKCLADAGNRLRELEYCGEFRQTGMIAAVELVRNKDSKEPFPPEQRVGYRIYLEGLKRGVFMRPLGDVIYFIPPLIITEKEIETMIDAAHESIRAVLTE